MPAIRYFEVTQQRKVKVAANSPYDAVRIAEAAFENGQNSGDGVIDGPMGVYGNARSKVRVTDIYCKED